MRERSETQCVPANQKEGVESPQETPSLSRLKIQLKREILKLPQYSTTIFYIALLTNIKKNTSFVSSCADVL